MPEHMYMPPITPEVYDVELDYRCTDNDCGYRWKAFGTTDLGFFDLHNDDDALCPECGAEGKEQ